MNRLDPFEEPLHGGPQYYYSKSQSERTKGSALRGPKRAIRLCLLCIVLPGLFIGIPLYLK